MRRKIERHSRKGEGRSGQACQLLRSRGGARARQMAGIDKNPRPPLSMSMQQTPAGTFTTGGHRRRPDRAPTSFGGTFFDCMPGIHSMAPQSCSGCCRGSRSIFAMCLTGFSLASHIFVIASLIVRQGFLYAAHIRLATNHTAHTPAPPLRSIYQYKPCRQGSWYGLGKEWPVALSPSQPLSGQYQPKICMNQEGQGLSTAVARLLSSAQRSSGGFLLHSAICPGCMA